MADIKNEAPKRDDKELAAVMKALDENWEKFSDRIRGRIEGCITTSVSFCNEPERTA